MRFNGALIVKTICTLLLALTSTASQTGTLRFHSMYVFGDSLSDLGNAYVLSQGTVPPDTRYKRGRFSNGGVWVDKLAFLLRLKKKGLFPSLDPRFEIGVDGGSYAYGASGTGFSNGTPLSPLFPVSMPVSGLLGQVEEFTSDIESMADPDALYIAWSGPNDYLLAGVPGTEIPFPPDPQATVNRIVSAVDRLYGLGAEHVLVLNMPDLGNTPIATVLGVQQQLRHLENIKLRKATQNSKIPAWQSC